MTKTSLLRFALLTSFALGLAASDAKAAFIGSFGLNGNVPAANPTSALETATSFSFVNLSSNGNSSGGFAGLPLLTVFTANQSANPPAITLTLGSATGFTFTNANYGTFTQTAVAQMTAQGRVNGVVTSEAFLILGTFSGGPVGAPTAASFTISFTQNGGPGSAISASGTLDIPPLGVPEPASVAMLGLGLAAVGGASLRRRAAK